MGNFNIQRFRQAAVLCLLDNNLPMELLSNASFREIINFANPEAEAALWVSPRSVATYAMRLFRRLQPQVVHALSQAASKIHISFDGWSTKGGKRGFFGSVAYFADASGVIRDLPIDLPLLAGAHTGEAISTAIIKTLKVYGITRDKLGYFVLDNAANDTAIAALSRVYDFDATHRRLRCGPHTLNLIGQAVIFGGDRDAYDNAAKQLSIEELYLQEWRKQGPLGVLVDVINYIKTPQQYELFREFQRAANAELPVRERLKVLKPVKPVVTRWNSYYCNGLEPRCYGDPRWNLRSFLGTLDASRSYVNNKPNVYRYRCTADSFLHRIQSCYQAPAYFAQPLTITLLFDALLNSRLPITYTQSTTLAGSLLTTGAQYS
ncbi:hypothetical protein A1F94_013550 [Pyrenophora tritici-repentis]|uniref:Uncharacterized protein n=1 Tax=Pyrenophora tritici-repentis TaxID=45151 RepID=A0A834S237_9PLEO|nr:hypothetical protein PtrM4_055980 [Pyrenophora tritici-repentis]KAG9375806.1 hypothetical protein A1F94_013550 [Pyrenophora tritici-repentis]